MNKMEKKLKDAIEKGFPSWVDATKKARETGIPIVVTLDSFKPDEAGLMFSLIWYSTEENVGVIFAPSAEVVEKALEKEKKE